MSKQLKLVNNCINQANNIMADINGQDFYIASQKKNDSITPIIVSPQKAKMLDQKLHNAALNISSYKDALEHTKYQLTHLRSKSRIDK